MTNFHCVFSTDKSRKLVNNRKLKKATNRVVQIQILHARIMHCLQFERALVPNSNLTMSDITHPMDEKTESQRNVSNLKLPPGMAGSQVYIFSLYTRLLHTSTSAEGTLPKSYIMCVLPMLPIHVSLIIMHTKKVTGHLPGISKVNITIISLYLSII